MRPAKNIAYPLYNYFFGMGSLSKGLETNEPLPDTGIIYRNILNRAGPSSVEMVLAAMMAIIDSIMVGTLGPAYLSAIGITTQPKFIALALITSLNYGVTAVVARRKGEKDRLRANLAFKNAIWVSFGIALVMNTLAIFFAEPLLFFAGAKNDYIHYAVSYFQITLAGNVFASVSLTINAAQRGVGNNKITMRTNLVGNTVKILFNYLLISGAWGFPRLEIRGAAIATAIGNIVALLMSMESVWRSDSFLYLRFACPWKPHGPTLKSIFKVSSSAAADQVFQRVGMFTYVKIIAELGTFEMAAHQICMNMLNMSQALGDGFGIAASSLVGEYMGAKRIDLSIIYNRGTMRCSLASSILFGAVMAIFRRPIAELFTRDPYIILMASNVILMAALICLVQTSRITLDYSLKGAGDTFYSAMLTMTSLMILRPIVSWVACYPLGFGLPGAWSGLLIDQCLRLFLLQRRFRRGRWAGIRL